MIVDILVILGNWSESCACHSIFWKLKSRSVRGKYFERLRENGSKLSDGVVLKILPIQLCTCGPSVRWGGSMLLSLLAVSSCSLWSRDLLRGWLKYSLSALASVSLSCKVSQMLIRKARHMFLPFRFLSCNFDIDSMETLWLIPSEHSFGNSMCIRLPCSVQSTAD